MTRYLLKWSLWGDSYKWSNPTPASWYQNQVTYGCGSWQSPIYVCLFSQGFSVTQCRTTSIFMVDLLWMFLTSFVVNVLKIFFDHTIERLSQARIILSKLVGIERSPFSRPLIFQHPSFFHGVWYLHRLREVSLSFPIKRTSKSPVRRHDFLRSWRPQNCRFIRTK